ncbi:MAG: ATP-binding cassette domain-containing protein [Planctomycetes bacterium]|nr:ATP-binding cassette domain-containing protein [Planctomycetota bacterium]
MTEQVFAADGVVRREDVAFELSVPGFEIGPGGVVAVVGSSGAGKSSLFTAWFGLGAGVRFEGERAWCGEPFPATGSEAHRALLRESVCIVPQDAHGAFDPLQRLAPQLERAVGRSRADRVRAAFVALGREPGLLRRFPHELSGGQLRSALLAVALAREAALTVADEPSVGLDGAAASRLGDELSRVASEAGALLIATHDLDFAGRLGATCWSIADGSLVRGRGDAVEWPRVDAAPAEGRSSAILELDGVAVELGGESVLESVDFRVASGESVAILGASGAGKSTLARVIAGRLSPAVGRVVRHCGLRDVQLVSQDAGGSLTPHRTVRELVSEAAAPGFALDDEADAVRLPRALLDRRPAELSGGERRRVALLRALAVRPKCLVLDEPTSDLDGGTAVDVVASILETRRRRPMTMIWITHDTGLAHAVANRVVTLGRRTS